MSRVMDSILEQLFYGNINVSEYFSPDKDSLFKDEKMAYREKEKTSMTDFLRISVKNMRSWSRRQLNLLP